MKLKESNSIHENAPKSAQATLKAPQFDALDDNNNLMRETIDRL